MSSGCIYMSICAEMPEFISLDNQTCRITDRHYVQITTDTVNKYLQHKIE